MKRVFVSLIAILAAFTMFGQDITGEWNGALSVQGKQLRLVFHITKAGDGFTAVMDSPDQGAQGIPVTSVTFENPELKIELANLKAEYSGTLKDNIISGIFKQSGMSFPLELTRVKIEKKVLIRPQEPVEPYPYNSEEITFINKKDKITLAGTLTLPDKEGKYPAVVLITGSGAENRNEEVFGHKPFLVLADYLTRKGIAVLRFDDRGTAGSEGDYKKATSSDFATDVESAVNYLLTRKEINKREIGLIGHSEGGIIAPMVAGRMKRTGFVVLLAGTAVRGDKLLLMQQELLMKAMGKSQEEIKRTLEINKGAFDIVLNSDQPGELSDQLSGYLKKVYAENPEIIKESGMREEDFVKLAMTQLESPWLLEFLRYDPAPALEKVKCPVLALNGAKDLQVPPEVNLEAIRNSLGKGGNKKVTIKELPGLNHLFQECKTGLPEEYEQIEQTMSLMVLEEIAGWILKQTK